MLRFQHTNNIMLFLLIICKVVYAWSYDSNTSDKELNNVDNDKYPFYHTIVINDIAEIMNEIDTKKMPSIQEIFYSNSGSDENIEELLSEYQHYLDKAQNQRKRYLEKYKLKNKVPLLPQDTNKKLNTNHNKKYNEYFYPLSEFNDVKPFQYTYSLPNNIVDFFIPYNSMSMMYNNKLEASTTEPKIQIKLSDEEDTLKTNTLQAQKKKAQRFNDPAHPSCYCQNNQSPCDCGCQECIVPFNMNQEAKDRKQNAKEQDLSFFTENVFGEVPKNTKHVKSFLDNIFNNVLNIRMKVDIQLPKTHDYYSESCTNCGLPKVIPEDDINQPIINVPSYYNYPTPLDNFGMAKIFKIQSDSFNPMHKITIHKKKKSRFNNNNKKHRKKGAIAFQNFNAQQVPLMLDDKVSVVQTGNKSEKIRPDIIVSTVNASEKILSHKEDSRNINNTGATQELSVTVNVAFDSDNQTTDYIKITNSIDETTESDPKPTSEDAPVNPSMSRQKREMILSTDNINNNPIIYFDQNHTYLHNNITSVTHKKTKISKDLIDLEKNSLTDNELLYWPNLSQNASSTNNHSTSTIYLETNNKMTNVNISQSIVRDNDNGTLKDAILKNVDWDNMDSVATVFLSHFGKYFDGVLTFCSDKICNSIKCVEKSCVHRLCTPENRQNQKGHCNKSNSSDNWTLMTTTDLSQTVVFDIVNILEDKLGGKIYGKGTFCVDSKCLTFVASKKTFLKTKCNSKALIEAHHCSILKT